MFSFNDCTDNGYDNAVFDGDDMEMVTIDNEFEVPLELASHPVLLDDLLHYVQRHQNSSSLYRSEFAVRLIVFIFLRLFLSVLRNFLKLMIILAKSSKL